jgi:glycosyltransferase involved in cell wall biosynthesis
MKVIRVLPELDFGGVESRIELQAHLHAPSDYQLRVCAFHKPGKTARALAEMGIPVDVLGVSPSPRNPAATWALTRYLREHRPDVMHASIAEANLHGLLAARLARVPVAIAEETGMPSHSRIARLTYRAVYRLASNVFGVTKAVAAYSRDVDRAPADRVRVVYNCAGPRFFPPTPADTRRRDDTFQLLLVGRLVPVKNQSFFLEAAAEPLRRNPHVKISIAGDGPLKSELEATIARLGLQRQVELLGLRTDVRELLSQAHAFALPSISEGCSISLIEAMASGVLALGSDVPGIREVMGDALASQWTAGSGARGAWQALLERVFQLSAAEREAAARLGQARVYEQFSPHAYVTKLARIYTELHTGKAAPIA